MQLFKKKNSNEGMEYIMKTVKAKPLEDFGLIIKDASEMNENEAKK